MGNEHTLSSSRVSNLKWRLDLRNSLAVSSDGLSGGLGLFWDESLDVFLLSQGERHFDVLIKEELGLTPWRATFVYGEHRVENRYKMWDLMRNLRGEWNGPWFLMGDFIEAMWQYKHFSETPRAEQQMLDFREVLRHCDLQDLGFQGCLGLIITTKRAAGTCKLDSTVVWPTRSGLFVFQELILIILALLVPITRLLFISYRFR
jgi:hypothetical protein